MALLQGEAGTRAAKTQGNIGKNVENFEQELKQEARDDKSSECGSCGDEDDGLRDKEVDDILISQVDSRRSGTIIKLKAAGRPSPRHDDGGLAESKFRR